MRKNYKKYKIKKVTKNINTAKKKIQNIFNEPTYDNKIYKFKNQYLKRKNISMNFFNKKSNDNGLLTLCESK